MSVKHLKYLDIICKYFFYNQTLKKKKYCISVFKILGSTNKFDKFLVLIKYIYWYQVGYYTLSSCLVCPWQQALEGHVMSDFKFSVIVHIKSIQKPLH